MRTKICTILAVFALTGALAAVITNSSAGADSTLPLHNNTAESGTDCPDTVNDYWHFVLTPNNGSLSFVSITLNLDGTTKTFSGSDIIPNGTQTDNVFVEVPAGFSLDDLLTSGSSAVVSPSADPETNLFNLSHVCDGSGDPSASGSLSVEKLVVANGVTVTTTTFDVRVLCTLNASTDVDTTLHLVKDVPQTIDHIPAGSTCTITEDTGGLPGNPTATFKVNGVAGNVTVVDDGDEDAATVTNTYQAPPPSGPEVSPSTETAPAQVEAATAVVATPGFTG